MIKKSITTIAVSFLLVIIVLLIFSRVPTPEEKDCLIITGVVEKITEGGVKDVIFSLENNKTTFYINRGLENGLDLATLQKQLTGKEVRIKYPDYFALLNASGSIRHMSKLEHKGKIIYSEIE